MALQVLFGSTGAGHVLVTLPQLPLPSWAARGEPRNAPVTAEDLLTAAYEGLRLATILACVGAANSLANPSRGPPAGGPRGAVRGGRGGRGGHDPGAAAGHRGEPAAPGPSAAGPPGPRPAQRRRRGAAAAGVRAAPLPAAGRGHGQPRLRPEGGGARATRRLTGRWSCSASPARPRSFGLLDGAPGARRTAAARLAAAARRDGRRRPRVRPGRSAGGPQPYRPDPWALPEWLVTAAGVGTAVTFLAAVAADPTALAAPVSPPAWPGLPLLPLVGILLALVPAWAAPPVPTAGGPLRSGCRPRRGWPRDPLRAGDRRYGGLAAGTGDVDLHVPEGELALVVGPTGVGKSTLLRCVNGLVPHFSGGTLLGRVTVAGRDTRTHPPRELADVVGVVGQDPLAGFVTDVVEDELAYGMESLGLAPQVMRKRVEETLDLLGLADLRDRPLRTLSGGQRQRVAIGSVLTTHPQVLVLDEPTSALDPAAAEEVRTGRRSAQGPASGRPIRLRAPLGRCAPAERPRDLVPAVSGNRCGRRYRRRRYGRHRPCRCSPRTT